MEEPRGGVQWLLAGHALLRRGGIAAVKLPALAVETGLTTGSFYHHFGGMPPYLDELARFYGSDHVRGALLECEDPDPRVRLTRLVVMARDRELQPLDAAMRDWAGSNRLAAEAVRGADEVLLTFVAQVFLDLGYEETDARARAILLMASGVARIVPPWPITKTFIDDILRILAP